MSAPAPPWMRSLPSSGGFRYLPTQSVVAEPAQVGSSPARRTACRDPSSQPVPGWSLISQDGDVSVLIWVKYRVKTAHKAVFPLLNGMLPDLIVLEVTFCRSRSDVSAFLKCRTVTAVPEVTKRLDFRP